MAKPGLRRSGQPELPEGRAWLTDEVRAALDAIRPPFAEKKRRTVLALAFARANLTPVDTVFKRDDVCAEATWYVSWKWLPDVAAAYEVCYKRVLEWTEAETIAQETYYRGERQRVIARYAAKAPSALASVMANDEQRGGDRINAALALIKLADPMLAQDIPLTPVAGDVNQTVHMGPAYDLGKLSDEELAALDKLAGRAASDPDGTGA